VTGLYSGGLKLNLKQILRRVVKRVKIFVVVDIFILEEEKEILRGKDRKKY
jgi:hypothetical protein